MKLLDRVFTPDEQTILLFLVGCALLGFAWSLVAPAPEVAPAIPEKPPVIDLRSADPAALETLPGIGPRMAERIIGYRDRNGFAATADLKNVPGVGDRLYEEILPRLVIFGVNPDSSVRSLIDINTASREELLQVPGFGPELVRRILLARHAGVMFHRPKDLLEIRGFGEKTIQAAAPYLKWE
jgi:competence protein ComEA